MRFFSYSTIYTKKVKVKLVLIFLINNIYCFAINPKKDYISTPKEYNINYTEEIVKNKNVEICIWICQPQLDLRIKNIKTIILAYGDYGNMSYYLPYIDFYTKLGFRVISFDYRGFGKSSPFSINQNILFYDEFAVDLKDIITYCKKELKVKKIGIVSLSMGTILTVIATQQENIEFIIAEGCVYNVLDIIERLKKIKNKEVIVSKIYDLPKKWGFIKSKILIFVANKDNITNIEDAQNIVIQNNLKRSLAIYEGNHLSVLNDTSNLNYYKQKVNLFLNGK
jgi:uncharacterized protein